MARPGEGTGAASLAEDAFGKVSAPVHACPPAAALHTNGAAAALAAARTNGGGRGLCVGLSLIHI